MTPLHGSPAAPSTRSAPKLPSCGEPIVNRPTLAAPYREMAIRDRIPPML